MRRASKRLCGGKLLIISLLALAALGALVSVVAVSSLLREQDGGPVARWAAGGLRAPRAPGKEEEGVGDQLADEPLTRAAQLALAKAEARAKLPPSRAGGEAREPRSRLVVLYTEGGRINTGVWPAWGGSEEGRTDTLNWAAAGVRVTKRCPVPCTFTHDDADLPRADAVLVESVNHPKFGLRGQLDWPARVRSNPSRATTVTDEAGRQLPVPPRLPAVGVFYYEPDALYPDFSFTSPNINTKVDFSVVASQDATLPITLVCPWGRSVEAYLAPPPPKTPGRLVGYFSEHGVSRKYSTIVDELLSVGGERVHAYSHRRNRETPGEAGGEPFQLSTRLDFVGTYRFLLITDGESQDDFLSPEWSQAFLAGTVPIYGGAPNAAHFAPGPRSFLSLDDFTSGRELWDYLLSFDGEGRDAGAGYARFFEWKGGAHDAYVADERGASFTLGTGQGVHTSGDSGRAAGAVRRWGRPPPPLEGGGEGEEEGTTNDFREDSSTCWRAFRRHLDRCVHYAECRVCRLVHDMT